MTHRRTLFDRSEDEQIEHFYLYTYLAECNDAMARMSGYSAAEELVGTRLGELLPSSSLENVEYLNAFVRSVYRLNYTEWQEVDRQGNTEYVSKRMCPYLVRVP